MKNFQFVILIFLSISLQAQQKPASAPAKPQVEIKLTNGVDSSQYILGAYLGQYLNANGIAITKPDLFIKGMDDVLTNKKLLVSADSIPKRMNEYMNQMVMERNRALEKQLFTNVKGQPGIGNLPDGVCYAIVKAGTGSRPLLTDSVSIHVKGYLPEGKIFETLIPVTSHSEPPGNTYTGTERDPSDNACRFLMADLYPFSPGLWRKRNFRSHPSIFGGGI